MMMKKYTEKDFETFERNEWGWLICPSGDYSEIGIFPEKCIFGKRCNFRRRSNFGVMCGFGDGCTFGEMCNFDAWNSFGDWCNFSEGCNFGAWSSFGKRSIFGEASRFGACSSFGKWCNFGERCSFGELSRFDEKCSHEGLTNSIYVAIDRIGSELRKTYFFKAEEGYFVRAGCFFGTLDEFKVQVHETHDGTIHETTYLIACDLAVKLLDSHWK